MNFSGQSQQRLFLGTVDGSEKVGQRDGQLKERPSCTFAGGHVILSFVFAVVQAAGEDQVIVVTLEEDSVKSTTGQEGAPCRGRGTSRAMSCLDRLWLCLAESNCLQ